MKDLPTNEIQQIETDVFWGEIAPCDHVVQIYESDSIFLDTLTGFVGGGIKANECVIIIATRAHLNGLEERLKSYGVLVDGLKSEDRYIPLEAEETLAKFMVDNWPDENLFFQTVEAIIDRAHKRNRKVRAFGEMVALLWAFGHSGATVQLEHLWNRFCAKSALSLFCAYPKCGFTEGIHTSIDSICRAHSKLIDGSKTTLSRVFYQNV